MKSISQIIDCPVSAYTGSKETLALVSEQVKAKYGPSELKNLDCYHNMRTYQSWLKLGFKVRRKEKAIRSITFVEQKDQDGNVLKRYRRPVFLFYYRQVEPICPKKYGEENDD